MKGDQGEITTSADALTGTIIDGIITVHRTLGPGFIESIYQRALTIELSKRGLALATEVEVKIEYDGQLVGRHRLDLVVEGRVLVELKTVEQLGKAHYAQVRSYSARNRFACRLIGEFFKRESRLSSDCRQMIPSSPFIPLSPFLDDSASPWRHGICGIPTVVRR